MTRRYLIWFIFLLATGHSSGQHSVSADSKFKILKQYLTGTPEIYGVFDNTDSYFVTHFDSVFASVFDSDAYLAKGKIWHRNQLTEFKAYISVDTTEKIQKMGPVISDDDFEDTLEWDHWGFQSPLMKDTTISLYRMTGEIQLEENSVEEFSGTFSGTFTLYFYFKAKPLILKKLETPEGSYLEPGFYSSGFWRGNHHRELGAIPFSFSNSRFYKNDDNEQELQDLRFQMDGSSNFSNIAIFPVGCMKPPAKWYQ